MNYHQDLQATGFDPKAAAPLDHHYSDAWSSDCCHLAAADCQVAADLPMNLAGPADSAVVHSAVQAAEHPLLLVDYLQEVQPTASSSSVLLAVDV